MSHILFISPYYPPENGAAPACVGETCTRLVKLGHQVTVLTTLPNYPTGIVLPEYRGHLLQKEVRDGVQVVRVWSFISPNKSFWSRIRWYLSFALLAPLFGGKAVGRPAIIIVQSPPLFDAIAVRILARWKRCHSPLRTGMQRRLRISSSAAGPAKPRSYARRRSRPRL